MSEAEAEQPKAKQPWYKHKWVIVLEVLFLLVVLGTVVFNNPTTNTDTGKANTEKLDLKVVPQVATLQITNNESNTLTSCKVEINKGYTAKVTLPANQSTSIDFGRFSKDGLIFDSSVNRVKRVVVTGCGAAPDRVGVYGSLE